MNTRKPSPVVKFSRSGRSASILSLIVPSRSNAVVSYTTVRQGDRMIVELVVDKVRTTIAVSPDGTLERVK